MSTEFKPIYVKNEIHKKLLLAGVEEEKTLRTIAEQALEAWLASREQMKKGAPSIPPQAEAS